MSIAWACVLRSCDSACTTSTLRVDAGAVAVLRHVVRRLERLHRVVEKIALHVGHAQLEVVGGELGLQREPRRLEVGGARFLAGARRLDQAADAAPQVDLPARVDGDRVAVAGVLRARCAGAPAQRREQSRARGSHRRARLPIARLRSGERLVGDAHLLLEPIEHRVLEGFPPLALRHGVVRLRHDPVAGFLPLLRGRRPPGFE